MIERGIISGRMPGGKDVSTSIVYRCLPICIETRVYCRCANPGQHDKIVYLNTAQQAAVDFINGVGSESASAHLNGLCSLYSIVAIVYGYPIICV